MNGDRDFVDRVRSAADIVRTVGEYVPLRKAGRRYSGLCPFHAEKTPSFYVDEQKQVFHCFGCGVGGDIFKFLMLHEKLEFREALEMLAERNGIEIPRPSRRESGARGLKERLYEANALAVAHFRASLAGADGGQGARGYLASRGLRRETIDRLAIGYAPRGWEGLKSHLLSRGFTAAELAASGLVVPRADGTGSYDRFRDRIIFPIVSASGKVVAFGGRTIAGSGEIRSELKSEPKYLNSPETPVYSKSETLYGLYPAREALRRDRFAVLVEGYLDFASLFEAGIENVVASLGTAFTEGHARLLARYVDGVIVNYDPDAAGKAAALRSLAPLVARGLRVKVLRLPAGEDPDLYVRRIGTDEYRQRLDSAPEYMDYVIEEAASGKDLRSAKSKVTALNQILPHLAAIESAIERSHYVPIVADRLSLEDDLILRELSRAAKQRKSAVAPPPAREAEGRPSLAETGLVRILIEDTEARRELLPLLETGRLGEIRTMPIIAEIRLRSSRDEEIGYAALSACFTGDEENERLLGRIAMQSEPVGDVNYGRECVAALERDRLQAECRRIQRRIETTSDGALLTLLTAQKLEMSQRIRELS